MNSDHTVDVLHEVLAERYEQDQRWGQQDHPVHHSGDPRGLIALAGSPYLVRETHLKRLSAAGHRSWAVILLEEVMEALAAPDARSQREEFLQVAAVAVAAVEALDRAEAQRHRPGCMQGQYHAGECWPESYVLDALKAFRRGVEAAPPTFLAPVARSCLDDLVKSAENPLAGMQSASVPSPDGTSFVVPLVPGMCGQEGCGPEYCPGGKQCRREALSEVRQIARHVYAGEGRLHGICRCGNGRDDLIHQCHTCDHPYHSGTVCRELCMPTPGNVDECGCDCGVAL